MWLALPGLGYFRNYKPSAMDKLVSDIKQLADAFQQSMKVHLPVLEQEVDKIIKRQSRNEKEIEYMLDTLYSLVLSGMDNGLFIKLLDYYKTVNGEAADWYWNEYDKLDDE
jgi:hypothetical protein